MADAFQTVLTLVRQSNGRYTLDARTTTPDSCRIADPAKLGFVYGQPVPSDAVAVILPTRRNQRCTNNNPAVIRHTLRDLRLPSGKTKVVAFLVINPGSTLLTTALVKVGGGPPSPPTPNPPIPTKPNAPTPPTPRIPRVHLPFETPPWVVR